MSAKQKSAQLSRLEKLIVFSAEGNRVFRLNEVARWKIFRYLQSQLVQAAIWPVATVIIWIKLNCFRAGNSANVGWTAWNLHSSTYSGIFWTGYFPFMARWWAHFGRSGIFPANCWNSKKYLPADRSVLNGIQTNGTLLNEEWCRFLKKENFIVGISLDGPERFHSVNRYSKDGHSSYERTINGFYLLKSFGIPCEILCVVHSQNVWYPLEVYRFFKSIHADSLTFIPLVERLSCESTQVSDRTVPAKAFGEF